MSRWLRFPVGSYGDDAGSVVISGATFWWILFPLLFPGCGDSVRVGGASGEDPRMRSVVFLFALGKVPLCSPVGFFFRVGDLVAGAGSSAGPWLPPGGCGVSFTSGSMWRDLLKGWISSASFARSPIRVQRFRSILAGAPGWWILRLHQGLRSSDRAVEVFGVRDVQPGGTVQTRKNGSLRAYCVISLFHKGLVVKGGCTVLLFNISFFFEKKRKREKLSSS